MQNHICIAIMSSGERRGQTCGKRAEFPYIQDTWYCKRHRKNGNILCEYIPEIPLNNVSSAVQTLVPDLYGEGNVRNLKGYINVLVNIGNESIPLVLMSIASPGEQTFTKATLAIELAKSVEYIVSRRDIYRVGGVQFDDIVLNGITYDNIHGIFVANLSERMQD